MTEAEERERVTAQARRFWTILPGPEAYLRHRRHPPSRFPRRYFPAVVGGPRGVRLLNYSKDPNLKGELLNY